MPVVRNGNAATFEQRLPQSARLVVRIDDDAVVQALVICGPLFRVRKPLICGLDRIESGFGSGMRAPVRVMAHRQRAVRLPDFPGGRGRRNAEDAV